MDRNVSYRWGGFLKNQMANVYENGRYVGKYPYRPFYDIVFRLSNSDRANRFFDTLYAKVLSLAYLSVGNRESYQYLQMFYMFLKRAHPDYKIDFAMLRNIFKNSGATRNFLMMEDSFNEDEPFPSLEFLRNLHDVGNPLPRPSPSNFKNYINGEVYKAEIYS